MADSNEASITATQDSQKVPEPFEHNGQTFRPVAVAMYGDMLCMERIGRVTDPETGELWAGHTILWAVDNGSYSNGDRGKIPQADGPPCDGCGKATDALGSCTGSCDPADTYDD